MFELFWRGLTAMQHITRWSRHPVALERDLGSLCERDLGSLCCKLVTAGLLNLQSMLLTDATEKLDPMSLLFYMSSFSVLLLLPATVVLEPKAFAQVRR